MYRINREQIQSADNALRQLGIVYKKEGKWVCPKAFKGYISTFAASIVQMGLYPAMMIYEYKSSGAESKRFLVPEAIKRMLNSTDEKKVLSDIYDGFGNNSMERKNFENQVEEALVALKMALRMYERVDEECYKKMEAPKMPDDGAERPVRLSDPEFALPAQPNRKSNVGWLYYRDYYQGYTKDRYVYSSSGKVKRGRVMELIFNRKKNPYIEGSELSETMMMGNDKIRETLSPSFKSFTLRTSHPGLLVGMGLNHGTPIDNDIKCGMQFDHSTGLPYIPGSSVKGAIRGMFPCIDDLSFIKDEKQKNEMELQSKLRLNYIKNKLRSQGIQNSGDEDVIRLTNEIFTHNQENQRHFDVFMDAVITGNRNNGKFLKNDFITPHKEAFKDPNPIEFLKVLPGVEFTFFFRVTRSFIQGKEVDKLRLFKDILLDVGIGAKTNVGYGHFINVQ